MSSGIGKFAKTAAIGLGAVGAIAIGVGVMAVEAAGHFEAAHARLTVAIKNSGKNINSYTKLLDSQRTKYEQLGYNQTEYQDALARIVTATGDVTKSTKYMGVASDLAAARGMSLMDASALVAKVVGGNTGILKRYGIQLPIVAGGALAVAKAQQKVVDAQQALAHTQEQVSKGQLKGTHASDALYKAVHKLSAAHTDLKNKQEAGTKAIDALGKKFSGSASAQAETFHGKVKAMSAAFEDVKIKLGNALMPALTTAMTWLSTTGIPAAEDFATRFMRAFNRIKDNVKQWYQNIVKWLNSVKDTITEVINAFRSVMDVGSTVAGKIGDWTANIGGVFKNVLGTGNDPRKLIAAVKASQHQMGPPAAGMPGGPTLGHARGGVGNFGAGTLSMLHGREAIIPLGDPARARTVAQAAGLSGGSNNTIYMTVVSNNPERAGDVVHSKLVREGFLNGRK
jgi:uncharacterized protein YukE